MKKKRKRKCKLSLHLIPFRSIFLRELSFEETEQMRKSTYKTGNKMKHDKERKNLNKYVYLEPHIHTPDSWIGRKLLRIWDSGDI